MAETPDSQYTLVVEKINALEAQARFEAYTDIIQASIDALEQFPGSGLFESSVSSVLVGLFGEAARYALYFEDLEKLLESHGWFHGQFLSPVEPEVLLPDLHRHMHNVIARSPPFAQSLTMEELELFLDEWQGKKDARTPSWKEQVLKRLNEGDTDALFE